MFESIEAAPADPILGLTEAFLNDSRSEKINLSVGVYKDEQGITPVLQCVKQAEQSLLEGETTKSYLGIGGLVDYGRLARELLFGPGQAILDRAVSLQTPGGTGALRVAGDFIHRRFPNAQVWCSKPTWANHPAIFQAAGVTVQSYAYLDASGRQLDFEAMMASLEAIPTGDIIVLHGCCHNPSGVDPSADQWQAIVECVSRRGLLPLVDFAYQGFGVGLDEDAFGLRVVAESCPEMLVCSSFSKNFGLYRERVGVLTAVASTPEVAEAALSHLKLCVRTNFSNPPAHGAAIVETILSSDSLRDLWLQELADMRSRISGMRQLFVDGMKSRTSDHDFSFLLDQAGMFSFSGLSAEQVDRLRDEFAIYIVRSGRINVAGITPANVDRLCDSIAAVLN